MLNSCSIHPALFAAKRQLQQQESCQCLHGCLAQQCYWTFGAAA